MTQPLPSAFGILPSVSQPPPRLFVEIRLQLGDGPQPSGRPRLQRDEVPRPHRDEAGRGREDDSKVGSQRDVVDLLPVVRGLSRNRSLKMSSRKNHYFVPNKCKFFNGWFEIDKFHSFFSCVVQIYLSQTNRNILMKT